MLARDSSMRFLLDIFYVLLAALAAPWWMRKARGGWAERFGAIEPLPPATRPRVMLHTVSVGETNLAAPLVEMLRPHAEVLITVTTDTGMERATALYGSMGAGVFVRRYPLDFSWAVRRFLDSARPDVVGLAELEMWPNFLRFCGRRGLPVAVLNGRISDHSFGRYRMARPLVGGLFRRLAFVAAQDEVYAERFRAMGVAPERCHVTGSMKWDAVEVAEAADFPGAAELAEAMGIDRMKPLIVAGSTEPVEHALLHSASPRGAQLLCAPRKPEWFDDAARDLPGCVRRSKGERATPGADRFLLDTIGELNAAYALADIVVVGRSFGELHGSDPMAPAAMGKPVVIGPRVANFRSVVETMLRAGAIVQTTGESLASELKSLIENEQRRRELSERAKACALENQGATKRHADLLRELLSRKNR
ncbi:MAG: 3-deoxy-D-manno-octulosonic acid transferase [Phycisphaeraceae bacterium]|nr:MAG: 3-deoxy-D-manno-octulosonic acid transferase [Phycisphaeraceae bacterium]